MTMRTEITYDPDFGFAFVYPQLDEIWVSVCIQIYLVVQFDLYKP